MGQRGDHGGQNGSMLRVIEENLSASVGYYSVSDGEIRRGSEICAPCLMRVQR